MKKLFTLLLVIMMCASLAACGGASAGTVDAPGTNDPTTDGKEYKAVEITMDNWAQYLEFSSKYYAVFADSAFSDVPQELQSVGQDFYFGVKETYFSRLDTVKSTITVRVSTDFGTQKGTFAEDYSSFDPNGEFQGSNRIMESVDGDFQVTDHGTFAWHMSSAAATSQSEWEAGELFKWLRNQQVLDISGTLYIAE